MLCVDFLIWQKMILQNPKPVLGRVVAGNLSILQGRVALVWYNFAA
ncbi:MAG: hypothetical protein HY506_01065 [Candidatus Yanofskybacteria bacterium]|nr:hypothetical protein [Candidatus Yanofskybacteria bacterium]